MNSNSAGRPGKLPKLALAAAIVAFLLAAIAVVSAFQHVYLVASAIVPAMAAITIVRRRVWGAYGFALFNLAQLAIAPVILVGASGVPRAQLIALLVVNLALALLFFLAGRSLAAVGAKRGSVFPWVIVSCLFTLPFFFFRAFVMPSGSMENTLLIGDRMIARVFPRVSPARGDIILFHYPVDRRQVLTKRVIGLPGDRIRIVSQVVYRNGTALAEPYVTHKFNTVDPYRDNLPANLSDLAIPPGPGELLGAKNMLENHVSNGEVVVPPGKFFVLGDSRDNSLDSRYWGFLDAKDIIGKPILIYDSQIENANGAKTASIHRTRWNRIFKIL